jgi:Protein of unknown function (DUF3433)
MSSVTRGPEPTAWDPFAIDGARSPGSPASTAPPAYDPNERQRGTDAFSGGHPNKLGKWGSIRRNTLTGGGKGYGPLNDVDEEGECIPIDISDFTGPSMMGSTASPVGLGMGAAGIELQSMNLPSTTSSMLPGIGGGTRAVVGAHTRGRSLADAKFRDAFQQQVDKQDRIVAIVEPGVDLTGLDGSDFAQRNMTTTSLQNLQSDDSIKKDANNEAVSFMFPKDPNMPSWRPWSMKWPYIVLLIIIALMLGVIQEVLCQISMRQKAKNSGLIQFFKPTDISTLDYFAWRYMPTMVLVIYGVMWQAVDLDVKRLEAFYQLSKPDGALAMDSLNLDYLTSMSYLIPFMAIKSKQWAVVFSSVATLVAGSLVPVLQAASVDVTIPKDLEHDPKLVNINPLWSRVMTASMGVAAILGASLLVSLRRKSGLLSDPKGIAGIASMATKSHILTDFEDMDTKSYAEIHSALRKRRYHLYKSSLWQGRFITNAERQRMEPKGNKLRRKTGNMINKLSENPLPVMLQRKASIPFLCYLVILCGVFPSFIFLPAVNKHIISASWILTLFATVVKLLWTTLDISLRVVEPLYILSNRNAPPKTLTLDYTAIVPGYLTFRAAMNKHYIVAFVSLGAILAEVLTVCVTSLGVNGLKFLPGKGGEGDEQTDRQNSTDTFRSFWISFGVAMFIMLYLLFVGILVAVRRHRKFLPRQPGSISSVLALIYSSNMLQDFINTEYKNSQQMTTFLEGLQKTYGLGWFNAKRDNKDHCGVDEEPLLDSYTHGKDWKETRLVDNVGGWEHYN